MVTFIIQARTGSTRLPQKILLPFFNKENILSLLIKKLRKIENTNIVIATSINENCDIIESFAKDQKVGCYRGSEEDVLQRFICAAVENNAKDIIRICSDNPFIELSGIEKLVAEARNNKGKYDYISFKIGETPSIKTHYGFWGEFVTLEALNRIASLTNESVFHEHVTNYIYSNPSFFSIKWLSPSCDILRERKIRLTIDTETDFKIAQELYKKIVQKKEYPEIAEIIEYLDNNPNYYEIMQEQIKQNTK